MRTTSIAFTGTRQGMTAAQKETVQRLLYEHHPDMIIHGDCLGADADFHKLAIREGCPRVRLRPGHNRYGASPTQAHCYRLEENEQLGVRVEVLASEPYLVRDGWIVVDGDFLIATPKGFDEEWRGSGTWATIRMAWKRKKPVHVVYPDGRVQFYKRD